MLGNVVNRRRASRPGRHQGVRYPESFLGFHPGIIVGTGKRSSPRTRHRTLNQASARASDRPRRVSGHRIMSFPGILRASIRLDSHPVQIQSATPHLRRAHPSPSVPSPSPSPQSYRGWQRFVSSSARATSCGSLACIFLRTFSLSLSCVMILDPTETLSWGTASWRSDHSCQ